MLLLLLLPTLVAGFWVCKKSPFHYYKLHRYEGQMLYLQSASIGLACSLLTFTLLALVDYFVPPKLWNMNIDLESFIIKITSNLLNLDKADASTITWIFLIAIGTVLTAVIWVKADEFRLNRLNKKYGIDTRIIIMGQVLADSPLDNVLYESYVSEKKLVMLSLSNRKVYVGVVNNMGEPNEVEGFDQEISLVPILSGYRDKDDLTVNWTTPYQDVDPSGNLRIVIRQELIESASEFDFDTWNAFSNSGKG